MAVGPGKFTLVLRDTHGKRNRKTDGDQKLGYGLGDLESNLFWQMFSIYIGKFYTDVFYSVSPPWAT
jgi:Na+/melibiose symporter-like transporter